MAGWHHQCNGHELGKTSGDGEGQEGLTFCSPWGHRVGYNWVTEQQQNKLPKDIMHFFFLNFGLANNSKMYLKKKNMESNILRIHEALLPKEIEECC